MDLFITLSNNDIKFERMIESGTVTALLGSQCWLLQYVDIRSNSFFNQNVASYACYIRGTTRDEK